MPRTSAFAIITGAAGALCALALAAEPPPLGLPAPDRAAPAMPVATPQAAPLPGICTLPINLPTALQLANVKNLDVALASERIRLALAQENRLRTLWLPTIFLGGDYARQDGQIQDVQGHVFNDNKGSLMAGAGPVMVFAVTDAIFEPLVARQIVQSRQASLQAATNDTMLAVAEAYANVQQARGELAGAEEALRRSEEVTGRIRELAPKLVPELEVSRARAELSRRRQAVHAARERWRVASAELGRLLRLDPVVLVEPVEPPHLEISLVPPGKPLDDLVAQGLTSRPELAAQQALVQAALKRIRQEHLRPLVPSVLLRGNATNPAGILSSGVFGGGVSDRMGNFEARNSLDLEVLWEFQNLGLGNRARIQERRSEHELSVLDLFRVQDRIAAEVVQAHAQVQSAAARLGEAETGLQAATESVKENFEGMKQTKRPGGDIVLLVVRPQEAIAAVQALAQAYADYYGTVADYNRAQFRLYRALGNPAQELTGCTLEK
ncbi:hypothetical protein AYO44_01895 [Planctomycetaceae bacterium SCGC AG-212-F19]|nr:hypothetical protein AYO44_01895 [Planctomycetaceae bacterium SCGC AG-212-F19]